MFWRLCGQPSCVTVGTLPSLTPISTRSKTGAITPGNLQFEFRRREKVTAFPFARSKETTLHGKSYFKISNADMLDSQKYEVMKMSKRGIKKKIPRL